eukprot:441160-Prymnesium_polylepis.1
MKVCDTRCSRKIRADRVINSPRFSQPNARHPMAEPAVPPKTKDVNPRATHGGGGFSLVGRYSISMPKPINASCASEASCSLTAMRTRAKAAASSSPSVHSWP